MKFIVLKGKEHKNVFWTTFSETEDYSKDYEILAVTDNSEKAVKIWEKHYYITNFYEKYLEIE